MFKKLVFIFWNPRIKKYQSREKVEKKISNSLRNCGECKNIINIGEEYYNDIFWREGKKNHFICESCWKGEKLSAKERGTKFIKIEKYLQKRMKRLNSLIL